MVTYSAMVTTVKPLRWMQELMGPPVLQQYLEVFGKCEEDAQAAESAGTVN